MNYKHVFDLDNTLVYTDRLNNNSYNYALIQHGLEPIGNEARITRDIIIDYYPHLSKIQREKIITLKQEFFINNMQDTTQNEALFNILKFQHAMDCVLWTSADEIRVQELTKYYGIDNAFIKIIYSNKIDVLKDVRNICNILQCKIEQLILYEDDHYVIKKLDELGLYVYGK